MESHTSGIDHSFLLAARKGNVQSRNEARLCQKRQNGGRALKRLCVSYPRFNGNDFCGEVTSHFWSSGGQLKRTQTYCVELLALYLRGMIIQIQYSMM